MQGYIQYAIASGIFKTVAYLTVLFSGILRYIWAYLDIAQTYVALPNIYRVVFFKNV